jgi:hypothetical protein
MHFFRGAVPTILRRTEDTASTHAWDDFFTTKRSGPANPSLNSPGLIGGEIHPDGWPAHSQNGGRGPRQRGCRLRDRGLGWLRAHAYLPQGHPQFALSRALVDWERAVNGMPNRLLSLQ